MAKHSVGGGHGPVDPGAGHETSDAHFRPIVYFLIGLTVLVAISFGLMVWMFDAMEQRAAAIDAQPSPLADPRALPPEPRLQVVPKAELDEYLDSVRRQIETYEWIDPAGGVVRIPVERAIELMVERGWPAARPAPAQAPGQEAPKE